jgi:hypothetical protein
LITLLLQVVVPVEQEPRDTTHVVVEAPVVTVLLLDLLAAVHLLNPVFR